MRHRIKHHVNRPVLHAGLLTDAQILPAAGLFTVSAGWAYAGGGGFVLRMLVAALVMLPVGVMIVDNRVGGIVVDWVRALVRWHRRPGIFAPGTSQLDGYALEIDAEDQLLLDRQAMGAVDLEAVFADNSA